ncbi:immunoglobulin-like domain-containing protein [Nitratifractor salsuginis]|uniref:PKD domain containing protein n=1 Tax=Nitratifractor salsuginis (strain DSM 16511 / JCM 12458 / E9I37-1) TaxID=749222 RepID=E6X2D7_NITSE|nr:immunoglobulin-like domain-containing protein [Nitratifractor salsuginis]ADV46072.1 PKD domain containing protein [Nitratifractor salsuginis DSM 16511]
MYLHIPAVIKRFPIIILSILSLLLLTGCGGGSGTGDPPDTTKPVITLHGPNPQIIPLDGTYTELGAEAYDDRDGNITAKIRIDASAVNTAAEGNYTVTYDVSDAAGNAADTVRRTVNVTVPPNRAPTADAGEDQTVTEGEPVTLDASKSTDSDGRIVSYRWTEGNTTLSTKSRFTKSDFTVGTHTVTLTVTDDDGASASDGVLITVNKKVLTYTLIYRAGPNGSLVGETRQTVDQNADGSEVTALPDNGYHFLKWSDGSTQNPRVDTKVQADLDVTAQFAPNEVKKTVIGPRPIAPTPLSRATLIASPDGSGDACTLQTPCSLHAALSRLNSEGGVLFLRGGIYPIPHAISISKKGTFDHPVIVESYPNERAILKGPFESIDYFREHLDERDRGVNIRGDYIRFRSIDVVNTGYEAIVVSGSHNIVEGCRVHDNHLSGIVVYGGKWHENDPGYTIPYPRGYNVIRDNYIYANSDEGTRANGGNADGISVSSGRYNIITHNRVYDSSDDGIDAWRSNYSYIAYNLSYNNGKADGDGNGFKGGGNCKRDDNGNCTGPNFEAGNGRKATFKNNISYGNRADGFDFNSGIDVIFAYNTAYHNGRDGFVGSYDARTKIHHNIAAANRNPMRSQWGVPDNEHNSWNIGGDVTFESEDPNASNFLVPVEDAFKRIGAYADADVDLSQKFYGVTLDSIQTMDKTIEALETLPKRVVSRVVFDEVPASDYEEAIQRLTPYTDIMGELCDSEYLKDYSVDEYKSRVDEYLDAFGDQVAIWEIGNEVNGGWTYDHDTQTRDDVAQKTIYAYNQAKSRGYKTALTLYYNDYSENDGCYDDPSEKMREWAQEMLPQYLREGIDYLFVSYYEENCDGHKPTIEEWNQVFDDLGTLFPNAKLGFGEVGATQGDKAGYLTRYYMLPITHERFVGGFFWWYFLKDMVPSYKALHTALSDIIKGEVKKYPKDTTLVDGDLMHTGYELDESIARPGYKNSVHEGGAFDTTITQVTHATGNDDVSPVHHYPKDPVWNADSSLMLLQADKLLVDARTYDPIHTFDSSSKKRLSRLNRRFRYGIGWVSSHHYGIVKENLRSGEETLLYEIPGTYDRITIGEYEGNMDYNDTYMLLTAHVQGRADDTPTFILYNFKTNSSVIKDFDGTNGTKVLHMTSDRVENRLNWATVSPLGRYVLVYHYAGLKEGKDGSHSTDWYKKIDKYDMNLNFIETLAYKGNHGDVCVSQDLDKEFYVQFENEGVGADGMYQNSGQKGIWQYDLETKERTMIVLNHGGGHVSCQNYKRPGWAYITYKSSQLNDRDIFAIMLGDDGVDIHNNRIVNRFAKARFMAEHNSGYGYSDRSAHATPSPDGTKVIFKSNWKEGEPLDDFVAFKAH